MNQFGNSNTPFFQIIKTSDIKNIKEQISDRLIITKQGKLYFDYSDSERIEISTLPEQYFTDIEFIVNTNETININYDNLILTNNTKVLEPVTNTLVFDKNGNIGIVIGQDDSKNEAIIKVLTKSVTMEQVNQIIDSLTVKRYYYN